MMRSMAVVAVALAASCIGVSGEAGAVGASASEKIVFTRQLPDGGANVFTAQSDGSQQTQVPLPDVAEDFAVPRWSPDRQHLLVSTIVRFDSEGNLLPFRPATVDPDGSNYHLLQPPRAPDSMGCFGGWLAAGTRLLCNFNGAIPGVFSIRSSDGGNPTRLTRYPFGADCNSCDQATDVSPDGTSFIFLRFKNENVGHQQVALYTEKVDGSGRRQLTPYGFAAVHELASARWSPNGREIALANTHGRLFRVAVDGSGIVPIHLATGTSRYFAFEPAWSPNGTHLVVCLFMRGQEDLYTARADGSNLNQVTDTPDFENAPDWGRVAG